jgi:transketolase
MGDLIGTAVTGTLSYVPYEEFQRIRDAEVDRYERALLFADCARLNALTMIACAGSGHIGSSFSSLDVVSWLYLEELGTNDLYFSSKGHDAPGLYAALIGLGRLPFQRLFELRRLGGLPGHPDVGTPEMVTNTGSLGMGISKAKGMALAHRARGETGRVYVLTGDGELQEGQIWESLVSSVNLGLAEITVLVDHNKLQSDTFVARTSALGDLEAKFASFGAYVERVDGHDVRALSAALGRAQAETERPQVLVLDTVKGRGVSFMEGTSLDSDVSLYRFHSGAPDARSYGLAATELAERIARRADAVGLGAVRLAASERPTVAVPTRDPERLIPAYANALVRQMEKTPELVVLDADLAVDTGQMPARERFPGRSVECGIAEMDMVSTAGGMALRGLLPVCHSFACFLATRANEQIYNNATEHTKVVYVASLAGLLPGGPGHSHQSLRDVSALAAVPGLVIASPSSVAEVAPLLEWCVERASGPSVLRLESAPCVVPYRLPAGYRPEPGVGVTLRDGHDATFVGYGPVLLSEAWTAAEALETEGISVGVVSLPWLNRVDPTFVTEMAARAPHLFCLDNHFVAGGQGALIAATLGVAKHDRTPQVHLVAVEGMPACGTNAEVLRYHRLDAESLVSRVREALRNRAD